MRPAQPPVPLPVTFTHGRWSDCAAESRSQLAADRSSSGLWLRLAESAVRFHQWGIMRTCCSPASKPFFCAACRSRKGTGPACEENEQLLELYREWRHKGEDGPSLLFPSQTVALTLTLTLTLTLVPLTNGHTLTVALVFSEMPCEKMLTHLCWWTV